MSNDRPPKKKQPNHCDMYWLTQNICIGTTVFDTYQINYFLFLEYSQNCHSVC